MQTRPLPCATGWVQVGSHQLWMDALPVLNLISSARQLTELRGQPFVINPELLNDPLVSFSDTGPELDALLSGSEPTALRRTSRLVPHTPKTLPLSRWKTRTQRLEVRLNLQELNPEGHTHRLRPGELPWPLSSHHIACGLIHAAYDLRGVDLQNPNVITLLGDRAQLLAQAARITSETPLHQEVRGGASLIAALIAAGWAHQTGQTGQVTLSRREFLHGVISLNLLQGLGPNELPHPGLRTRPSVTHMLTWERLSSLIGSVGDGSTAYLAGVAQLQQLLPGFQLQLPSWPEQVIASVAAMVLPQPAAPSGLISLQKWWNESDKLTDKSAALPGLDDERTLRLDSAPAPWPGLWREPGSTTESQNRQLGAVVFGLKEGRKLSDYSGWRGTYVDGHHTLKDRSVLNQVSLVSGHRLSEQHTPSNDDEFTAKLRDEFRENGPIYEMKIRDWTRVLNINQNGAPLPGYEALHTEIASWALDIWNLPAEPSALRRLPGMIRRSLRATVEKHD